MPTRCRLHWLNPSWVASVGFALPNSVYAVGYVLRSLSIPASRYVDQREAPGLAALRRDDDDAIRRRGAVERRRRRPLHDLDALDLVRVDVAHPAGLCAAGEQRRARDVGRHADAVDDEDRLVAEAHRRQAADARAASRSGLRSRRHDQVRRSRREQVGHRRDGGEFHRLDGVDRDETVLPSSFRIWLPVAVMTTGVRSTATRVSVMSIGLVDAGADLDRPLRFGVAHAKDAKRLRALWHAADDDSAFRVGQTADQRARNRDLRLIDRAVRAHLRHPDRDGLSAVLLQP